MCNVWVMGYRNETEVAEVCTGLVGACEEDEEVENVEEGTIVEVAIGRGVTVSSEEIRKWL